ncbi:hypothetical protein, partial [Pseudomonas juntendi]|uniref:hypothetical protein n=1 Tax=Pseudomonas juntendi TaxID=2666183 RepID=UPI003B93842B
PWVIFQSAGWVNFQSAPTLGHLDCLAGDGQGPVAELVAVGRAKKSLKVISLPAEAKFHKDLVPAVFPSATA